MNITKREMKMLMKNAIKLNAGVLMALAALAGNVGLAQSTASYEWRFDSSANPALSDVSPAGASAGLATIAPDRFSDGWMEQNEVLGNATGIWDLGSNGLVTLSSPSGLVVGSGEQLFKVKVVQFYDGGIYPGIVRVSVPGAQLVGTNKSTASLALLGAFIIYESQWRAAAGVAINSITFTGSTLIDRVTVESSAVSLPPPQLAIRRNNDGSLEISWPASYSTAVLESNVDVADAQGWKTVQAPTVVNGDIRSVGINTADAMRFYRLKQ